MRRAFVLTALAGLGAVVVLAIGSISLAGSAATQLRADRLVGYQEAPAVSTVATGSFRATIEGANRIDYALSFSNLEGTVTQAHIHFAQRNVSGGISVWLCETTANPRTPGSPDVPECTDPQPIRGTITPAHVVGPTGQGIAPGEWQEFLRAVRAGLTYANVHSSKFTGGEIRGQITARQDDDDDD